MANLKLLEYLRSIGHLELLALIDMSTMAAWIIELFMFQQIAIAMPASPSAALLVRLYIDWVLFYSSFFLSSSFSIAQETTQKGKVWGWWVVSHPAQSCS